MDPHDRWLELAALDELGELTAGEAEALRAHLRECAECRASAAATADVTHGWLPLAARPRPARDGAGDARAQRDDFLARARADGLRFSEAAVAAGRAWPPVWMLRWNTAPVGAAAAVAVLLAVVWVRGAGSAAPPVEPRPAVVPVVATAAGAPVSGEARRLADANASLQGELDAVRGEMEAARTELVALRQEVSAERERTRTLEQLLVTEQQQVARGRAELLQAKLDIHDADTRLVAGRHQLDALRAQLERAQASSAADRDALEARAREFEDLTRQVQVQTARADRAHELLAADRDIRDLMSARNLHIVDVRDTDARGKTRQAFGRVFYTEGKSLIFYAYDLEPSRLQNAAFQVWGAKTGSENRAVSLGMLFSDDQNQARWMMKFDNPRILREIDSVFVTVERPGGSKQPSNQRMLYAYLLNEPNHR